MNTDRKNRKGSTAASSSAMSRRTSLWNSLNRGDRVTVTLGGFEYHSGSVDDRTADGRTIWVIDRIGERKLIHIDDETELFIAPGS
ncbi:hypothetical protein [Paenarthrobacter nitroguajacolicus]|uniref:hypothetical protein n=1 Tax=Paenarthrobacter nitroguajacolicus TaxID=211146 RepID=UPI000B243369|nr:hypothetical protein [Paenarthrobacter nitroguajacolicus]